MKTRIYTIIATVLSLLLLIIITTGCVNNDEPNPENRYLTLGVILPMDQEKGLLREQALRTAIDEINEAGGVGDDYEIRLAVKSSEGADRKEAAAVAAREIILESDYLIGFISSFSSSSTGIVEEVGIPDHFPIISGSATASSLSGISQYFQRLCAPDSFEANILAQQAIEYGITSVAIAVEEGDAYSEELAAAFQNAFGIGSTTIVNFDIGDPDYNDKINQLLLGNHDGVFVSMLNPDEYNKFFTEMGNIYSNKKIGGISYILCDGLKSTDLFQAPVDFILGEVNGHPKNFGAFPSADTSNIEFKYFKEQLYAQYMQEVASYNAQFYDIGYLYALAIQRSFAEIDISTTTAFRALVSENIRPVSNENDGDTGVYPSLGWKAIKAIAQVDNIDYFGASGNCNIDENGNAVTPYSIFKVTKPDNDFEFEIIKIIP